jgi:hypothetical protein
MKRIVFIALLIIGWYSSAQITLIPDPYFEGYLIALGIDSDGTTNGQVLTSDIENVESLSFLNYNSITDITGIEDFASLETLHLYYLNITHINLSNNFNLKDLRIGDVSLESIDITNNLNLEFLSVGFNCSICVHNSTISDIDISNNILLYHVGVYDSHTLLDLDLSSNINISDLRIHHSQGLTHINLKSGNNTNIIFLEIEDNHNLECIQVDDPTAVIEGNDPPYDNWTIDGNPLITDDCDYFGLDELVENSISIYPNPVHDLLRVAHIDIAEITSLKIYDVIGRMILKKTENIDHINVSVINSGIFILEIETDKGFYKKKFVKE